MNINEASLQKKSKDMFTYRFTWLHLARPMTFTGTISPILAGSILAFKNGPFHFDRFIGFILSALMVQSSVNMLNDYYDFQNGQDHEKWVLNNETLFKQGPRIQSIPYVVTCMLFLAAFLGIWLATQSSVWVVIIGILGITFGILYSAGSHSLSSLGFGEITAAIFLGIVPTTLSYMIQGLSLDIHIFLLSMPFAFLIATMILTNNIRDIEKDQPFRRTLAMRLGRLHAPHLLTLLLASSYCCVLILISFKLISVLTGIVIFAVPLAYRLRWSYRPTANRIDEISGMKWAAWHHWAFGLLFTFGFILSVL
ncbi:MAG: 1,4-dihydroxy-2-naphthoate octaprenyltransferase [Bacillota bacterium]|nr:1,4-dihydroxy-2-naphthoate octaprenyltransferase [Bacillota bacterium]